MHYAIEGIQHVSWVSPRYIGKFRALKNMNLTKKNVSEKKHVDEQKEELKNRFDLRLSGSYFTDELGHLAALTFPQLKTVSPGSVTKEG